MTRRTIRQIRPVNWESLFRDALKAISIDDVECFLLSLSKHEVSSVRSLAQRTLDSLPYRSPVKSLSAGEATSQAPAADLVHSVLDVMKVLTAYDNKLHGRIAGYIIAASTNEIYVLQDAEEYVIHSRFDKGVSFTQGEGKMPNMEGPRTQGDAKLNDYTLAKRHFSSERDELVEEYRGWWATYDVDGRIAIERSQDEAIDSTRKFLGTESRVFFSFEIRPKSDFDFMKSLEVGTDVEQPTTE